MKKYYLIWNVILILVAASSCNATDETVVGRNGVDESVIDSTTTRCLTREFARLRRTESGKFLPDAAEDRKQKTLLKLAEQQCSVVELMCSADLNSRPCQQLLQLYEN